MIKTVSIIHVLVPPACSRRRGVGGEETVTFSSLGTNGPFLSNPLVSGSKGRCMSKRVGKDNLY